MNKNLKFYLFVCLIVLINFSFDTPRVKCYTILSERQVKIKNIANHVGNSVCSGEMCFGQTLQSIVYSESTFGQHIISGTRSKKNIKNVKIKVSKDKSFTINGIKYSWAVIKKKSLGAFQIRIITAKEVIEKMQLKEFEYLLKNDVELTKKLLIDNKFSAKIAANYLKYNYEVGKRRGVQNPWRFTVSRYNGGNINRHYIELITRNLTHL